MGVNNWIINSKGEILVQKRSRLKSNNPLKWSSTNGLREIGENSVDAVIRESSEELGIEIDKDKVKFVDSRIAGDSLIVDIFFTLMDVKIEDIKIQEEEVEEIRFVSPEDLVLMDLSTTCEYIKDNIAKYLDIVLK
ncbi:MAG: NUDIX domain-containing protein [Bacilli bacterium]|nr:NUDIX domain-containing protein [Bacilli bacterium]